MRFTGIGFELINVSELARENPQELVEYIDFAIQIFKSSKDSVNDYVEPLFYCERFLVATFYNMEIVLQIRSRIGVDILSKVSREDIFFMMDESKLLSMGPTRN